MVAAFSSIHGVGDLAGFFLLRVFDNVTDRRSSCLHVL